MAALVGMLAAVGALSLATTSASAFTIKSSFTNWVVSGTLTAKKLNQTITLPEGSTFNGEASVELATITGTVTGVVAIPPFNTTLKILGIPATVGLTFTQVGTVAGSIEPSKTEPKDVILSVPTNANIGFTTVSILGLTIPTSCETSKPASLPLKDELTLVELLTVGSHFTGTTSFPSVRCGGLLGPIEGALLTTLFSGPNNPFAIAITPPV